MKTLSERLNLYMDAGFPILYLETLEEDKAMQIIVDAVANRPLVEWNVRGLFFPRQPNLNLEGMTLPEALGNFASPTGMENENFARKFDLNRKLLILKDMQPWLEDANVIAQLKFLAEQIATGALSECNIVILSPMAKIPRDLEHYITILTMGYPDTKEIRQIVENFCAEQEVRIPGTDFMRELTFALKGLHEFEIKNLLALAIAEDGEIYKDDLMLIHEQKEQMVKKSGIMEMVPLKESIDDIGGLDNLKNWLKRKAKILKNIEAAQEYGVAIPKGVLIAGLPGCGKSLSAKATAALFGVPLLRLDMGRLMGKYVGESEANLRRAIALAEAISPCVLWIDELEKAFAGIGGQGGGAEVTTRLFGTFLTWMQEKEGLAFVVATANDINKLPPELLRKGRFDEIFYGGLPNKEERKKIFAIKIGKKRHKDLDQINLDQLAEQTNGFSGADIEGVVKDAIETAFARDQAALTTQDLLTAIKNTASLSEIMKESIDKMAATYKKNKFKNASL